jgi:hypothetical protein
MNGLRIYCSLLLVLGLFIAVLGLAEAYALPYVAADALAEAVRGARNDDEVRSRIVGYYNSTCTNRLVIVGTPGLAIMVLAVLSLMEATKAQHGVEHDTSSTKKSTPK